MKLIRGLHSSLQGYSSLAVALVLPESGCLVACERDARSIEIAKKYYKLASVADKVWLDSVHAYCLHISCRYKTCLT